MLFLWFFFSCTGFATETAPISIYSGYVTQIHCQGKLYLSSVGNEKLTTLQAIPKELGCGVILTPEGESGRTDLLLKTSTGDHHILIEIKKAPLMVSSESLEIWLKGGAQ
jgi:hypothetical protein